MKSEVIEALHDKKLSPPQRFQKLFDLYRKHPEALPILNRSFNAQGYSPVNIQSIEYELKKVYKIRDTEVAEFVAPKDIKVIAPQGLSAELSEKLAAFDIEKANYAKELVPMANEVAAALKVELPSKKGVDLKEFLKSHVPVAPAPEVNPFEDAPDDVKTSIKLRDEFPFLSEADCPDKFKILIADKMTAYENYKASREDIQKLLEAGASEEELFEKGKQAVENFELNLDIYDELNHYKEHKQILGKHPIFKEEMLQAQVDAYSTKDLIKTQRNLRSYISRETKVLDKMEDSDDKTALTQKVADWTAELELIDKRLAETK